MNRLRSVNTEYKRICSDLGRRIETEAKAAADQKRLIVVFSYPLKPKINPYLK
jgi:hypothetical protein